MSARLEVPAAVCKCSRQTAPWDWFKDNWRPGGALPVELSLPFVLSATLPSPSLPVRQAYSDAKEALLESVRLFQNERRGKQRLEDLLVKRLEEEKSRGHLIQVHSLTRETELADKLRKAILPSHAKTRTDERKIPDELRTSGLTAITAFEVGWCVVCCARCEESLGSLSVNLSKKVETSGWWAPPVCDVSGFSNNEKALDALGLPEGSIPVKISLRRSYTYIYKSGFRVLLAIIGPVLMGEWEVTTTYEMGVWN